MRSPTPLTKKAASRVANTTTKTSMTQGARPMVPTYSRKLWLMSIAASPLFGAASIPGRARRISGYFTTTSRGREENRSQPVSVTRIVSLKPTP